MTAPIIRPAEVSDAPALARIRVASWRAAYAGLVPDDVLADLDEAADTTRFATALADADSGRQTLVACDEPAGPVLGYVSFGPDREQPDQVLVGEVYAVYLDPPAWRRGLGAALMHAAERELVRRGATRARVWTLARNAQARAFYDSRGYTLDIGAVRPPRVGAAEVRLSVALHPDDDALTRG